VSLRSVVDLACFTRRQALPDFQAGSGLTNGAQCLPAKCFASNGAVEQRDEADGAGASDGAPQLISVFGRHERSGRVGLVRGRQRGLLALLLALPYCSRNDSLPTPWQVSAATDLDDARASLLIHLHSEAREASRGGITVTCIVVEGAGEPTPRLLRRLSGRGLGLKAADRCIPREGRFVDAIWGTPAAILTIHSLSLIEPEKATAFGTFGLGGLWCGGGEYSLEFRLGRWQATPEGARIIC
jgi:hypothetical protein